MATDPPAGPGAGPGKKAGKKIAGIPVLYLATGGIVLGASLIYFWWKARTAAAAATSGSSTQATVPADNGTAITGEELAQLLSDLQQSGTSTGSTDTGTSGGGSSGGGGYDYGGWNAGQGNGSGTSAGAGSGSSSSGSSGSSSSGEQPGGGGSLFPVTVPASAPPVTTPASTGSPPARSPAPAPAPAPPTVTYTSYTVKKGETLAELAKRFGISVAQLAHSNVYVPGEVAGDKKVGQTLGTGAGLKTGQVLRVPHYS